MLGKEYREHVVSFRVMEDSLLPLIIVQAMSIWVPGCHGHFASLLSTLDVKSSTGDMSARLETWLQVEQNALQLFGLCTVDPLPKSI